VILLPCCVLAGGSVDAGGMDVQMLVIADCPNERAASQLLRRALDDVGLSETQVRTRVIHDDAEAKASGFIGSPTFLLNGVDPFAQPGAASAVACRVYAGETGRAGVPSLRDLRRELKRAADRPAAPAL
jgi:hypothetical protein